ncbi:hypothetical protein DdX_04105 [Ditylenchus destructor]|uniref:Uncharacterized protein n=1 Tax=Ditylenchus destructor TaxID=166010 RepID=A0AAD4RBQ7_9BILA|nr:hypothetical protein DdX_04105 [Ditylenchus destructor]
MNEHQHSFHEPRLDNTSRPMRDTNATPNAILTFNNPLSKQSFSEVLRREEDQGKSRGQLGEETNLYYLRQPQRWEVIIWAVHSNGQWIALRKYCDIGARLPNNDHCLANEVSLMDP